MSSPLFSTASITAVLDNLVQGDLASGVVDTGNPISIGGKASSTIPVAVSTGQRVGAYFDTQGYLWVKSASTSGDVAVGTIDSGNPVKIGGFATSGIPVAVSDGQRVNGYFDNFGRLHVIVDQSVGGGSTTSQGTYVTSAPTLTNGGINSIQLDVNANLKAVEQYSGKYEDNTNNVAAVATLPLAVSTYSWTQFKNLQANSTLNVKSSPGNVKSVYCHNIGGSSGYIQLHNTTTTPVGGSTPIYSFLVPSGGVTIVDGAFFGENGMNFATGIAFAVSSTEITYTADTAGNYTTFIQFK